MDQGSRGQFSGAPSSLGYFFQCRYALLVALQRLSEGESFSASIETLDDVVFQSGESAVEVLQTKHHLRATARLTNGSPDLWKTLRIWITGLSDESIPTDAKFFLVTTAECGAGTAASYLRVDGRNEELALEHLSATASSSVNEDNRIAYDLFLSLQDQDRRNLIRSITVLDGAPTIEDLDQGLLKAVYLAVKREHRESYLQRVEGWWYERVVRHLVEDPARPILGEELEAQTNFVREQFREDSLPVDPDIMQATVDASGYQERPFVEQLKLAGILNEKRIVFAIKNYYRAFEQRSRWVREDLLYIGELSQYEERLIEEWDVAFQQLIDEIGEDAAEDAMVGAAQSLYKWVESANHPAIRPAVTEPAIARGSYHILADKLRVGWHPKFEERLRLLVDRSRGEA